MCLEKTQFYVDRYYPRLFTFLKHGSLLLRYNALGKLGIASHRESALSQYVLNGGYEWPWRFYKKNRSSAKVLKAVGPEPKTFCQGPDV